MTQQLIRPYIQRVNKVLHVRNVVGPCEDISDIRIIVGIVASTAIPNGPVLI